MRCVIFGTSLFLKLIAACPTKWHNIRLFLQNKETQDGIDNIMTQKIVMIYISMSIIFIIFALINQA